MITVIILSSRQLGYLKIPQQILQAVEFIAFISSAEHETLASSTRDWLTKIECVPIISHDGVLWEYKKEFILDVINNLPRIPGAIITFDEGSTFLASQLRDELRIPGASAEEIKFYRDKLIMKSCISNAGLKTPTADLLPTVAEWPPYAVLEQRYGSRMVIKPIDSAGSNSVFIINNSKDLGEASDQIRNINLKFEVESYIDGKLYHCDTIWLDDKLIFAACTEYVAHTVELQNGFPLGGRVLNPKLNLTQKLVNFSIKAVKALGLTSIVQHTELMVSPNGIITFIESGARPPGMLVVQMYERAFGLNILTLTLAVNLGDARLALSMTSNTPYPSLIQDAFYLVYPRGHGLVKKLNPLPIGLTDNIDIIFHAKKYDIHNGCRSNLDFTTTVLCSGGKNYVDEVFAKLINFKPIEYFS